MPPDRPSRLFALVDSLSGRRARTPDEIAEHFGDSKRSVYRDLSSLHEHSKIFPHEAFGCWKVTVEQPLHSPRRSAPTS